MLQAAVMRVWRQVRHQGYLQRPTLLQPFASFSSYATGSNEIYDSVVKITSTSLRPSFFQPWQLKGQSESSGSGFAISDRLILTNAHVVADNAFATVRRHGSSERYKCSVAAIAHECDLALLAVEEPGFWQEPGPMKPLELGDIPKLQDEVIVVGYPTGGSNICVTQGVVSRVGMTPYAHTGTSLLAVQIDAAINPGNSGGPALKDGKVVGVAFQDLENAENVGYVIPAPVIRHFLAEVEREGAYRGVSALGVRCQPLESPAARRALGMGPAQAGVLVVSVLPLAPATSRILPGDVLLSFDGTPIANDGTILFRRRERISFEHLVTLKVPGDPATLRVLREGREVECTVHPRPLSCPVPMHQYEQRPSYLIYGGLVFMPLSQPYLMEWGEEGEGDWQSKCPQNLYHLAMNAEAQEPGQQVIILSQVLADDVNFGYSRLENLQLLEVDGVAVRDMRHLAQLLVSHGPPDENGVGRGSSSGSSSADGSGSGGSRCGTQPPTQQQYGQQHHQEQHEQQPGQQAGQRVRFVRFTLERNQVVILDRREAEEALPRILDTHRIPARCSRDMCSAGVEAGAQGQPAMAAGAA